MEFMNLKERIKTRSTFSFEKVGDRFVVGIECIGIKYSVTFSTNIQYQDTGNINIDGELKNLLINGLIESDGFVQKLEKVENREKNLDILL
jgi:hypothetical protein